MAGSASLDDRRSPEESAILDQDSLDEDMHYRFFNVAPNRVARAKAKGYEIVTREDGVRLLTDQADDDGTGAVRLGDRVLMACPKDKYEQRARSKLALANARLRGPAEAVKTKARRAGVKVLEGSQRQEPGDKEE